jgi:hypothetical protein
VDARSLRQDQQRGRARRWRSRLCSETRSEQGRSILRHPAAGGLRGSGHFGRSAADSSAARSRDALSTAALFIDGPTTPTAARPRASAAGRSSRVIRQGRPCQLRSPTRTPPECVCVSHQGRLPGRGLGSPRYLSGIVKRGLRLAMLRMRQAFPRAHGSELNQSSTSFLAWSLASP